MASAFNVFTEAFEDIDSVKSEDAFEQHKPRKPPYQSSDHATRMLFVHKQDRYVVWVVGGKHFLLLHPSELDKAIDMSAYQHLDTVSRLIRIGDFINQYKLDRANYTSKDPKRKSSGESSATTKKPKSDDTGSTKGDGLSMDYITGSNGQAHGPAFYSGLNTTAAAAGFFVGTDGDRVSLEGSAAVEEEEDRVSLKGSPAVEGVAEGVVSATFEGSTDGSAAISTTVAGSAAVSAIDGSAAVEEVDDLAAGEDLANGANISEGVEATAAAGSSAIEDLQEQLSNWQERARTAEADAENERRKHKDYIKRKSKEVSKLKTEIQSAPSHEEMERMKQEIANGKKIMAVKETTHLQGKTTPLQVIREIIKIATDAYQARIKDAKERGKAYDAEMDKKEAALAAKKKSPKKEREKVFQFEDDNSTWQDITDAQAITTYSKLHSGSISSANISFGGQSYFLQSVGMGNFTQRNTSSGKVRNVRFFERDKQSAGQKEQREKLYNGMRYEDRNAILFGDQSPIVFTDAQLDTWMKSVNFALPMDYQMSLELAQLADIYALCSESGNHYVVDHGTQPSNPQRRDKHFVSHTDGTYDFNCEIWVKPAALSQWLAHAHFRNYRHARIVCHGAGKEALKKMRAHGIGMSMDFAGTQGQAYGPGFYVGLSDHATCSYNVGSGCPSGSFVLGLVLTHDANGWQHQAQRTRNYQHQYQHQGFGSTSGPFGIRQISEADIKNYKTINFSSHVPNCDNAMVVHDPALLLCIGFVHAFDKKNGKGWLE